MAETITPSARSESGEGGGSRINEYKRLRVDLIDALTIADAQKIREVVEAIRSLMGNLVKGMTEHALQIDFSTVIRTTLAESRIKKSALNDAEMLFGLAQELAITIETDVVEKYEQNISQKD